ncbi:MAG: polyketide synthase dehydratase domain-containing protein [Myxococcales bacterium]|nr:polyketide synthase dehydratase domain-containing protein [Myxococcales bacterium]
MGALWVAGVPLRMERVFPEGGEAVALPGYPWQRRGFWFAHDAGAAHPLIGAGRRVEGGWRFEAAVSAGRPALLADHRYGGEVVVAGAVLVSAALDAAARAGVEARGGGERDVPSGADAGGGGDAAAGADGGGRWALRGGFGG